MSSTTQGSVLGGRYRLERRIHTDPDGALWQAVDSTLEREVAVRVLRPGHPFAADVADAARRAALVEDPRLIRVLDVGTDGDVQFVVAEEVAGETLAAVVERGPLPAPVARRLVGEAAEGLAAAGERGLHHLRLNPRSVLLRADGSVKIIGTAVEAAAAGLEPDHAATANRVDAVALAGLLYCALTGRWPLGDTGFPPAPRGDNGPVPPGELARSVPNDLDTLCAVTLGRHNDGPRSPAEMAAQLAPWPSADEAPVPVAPARNGTAGPSAPVRSTPAPRPATTPAPSSLFAPITPSAPDPEDDAAEPADEPEVVAVQASAEPAAADDAAAPLRPALRPAGRNPRPRHDRTASASASAAETASAAAEEAATRPAPPRPRPPHRPAPPRPAARDSRPTPPRGARRLETGELLMPWSGSWTDATNVLPPPSETTGPFPILIPPEPPPREQSRKVLLGVAAALVIGLVLAVFSLRDLGHSDAPSAAVAPLSPVSPVSPTTRAADTAPPPTSDPATTAPTPSPSASGPAPVVKDASAIDPQGDGDENSGAAADVLDGSKDTTWTSDTYHSSAFGGLKKGLGLVIELDKAAPVTDVVLAVPVSGGKVEVRGGDSDDYQSSDLLGKADLTEGKVTVHNDDGDPATTYRDVIIWFTELPPSDGGYRAQVSEVAVK